MNHPRRRAPHLEFQMRQGQSDSGNVLGMSTRRSSSQPSAALSSPLVTASPRSTRANAGTHDAAPLSPRATRGESVKPDHPAQISKALASASSPRSAKALQDSQVLEALSTSEIKVLSLGRIINQPAFHSSKFIFPVNFKTQYLRYPSVNDPSRKVAYTCWVEESDKKPVFIVQCSESPMKFTGSSPTAAWEAVEANLSELRRSSARGNKRDVDGMALFGLSNSLVAKAIAKLPGADEVLSHYAPKPPPPAALCVTSDSPKRGGAVAAPESVFSIFNKKSSAYKKPPPLPKLTQGSYRWLEANLEAFEPPVCGNKVEFCSVEETLEALQSMWQAVAIVNFCRTFKSVIGLPFHMTDLASALFDAPSSILLRHLHLRLLMPGTPKNDTRELCDRENAWLNMLHARLHLPQMSSYSDSELLQFANVSPVSCSDSSGSAAANVKSEMEADVEDAASNASGPVSDLADDEDREEFFWSIAFDDDPFPGEPSSWFTLSLYTKLNILLLLCEEALATCELFRTRTSMDEDAGDVRGAPVCIDKDGAYYWYMADDSSAAIYKEVPPRVDKKLGALMPGSCEMAAVCNSVEDMTNLATSWKRSKHNDEKKMSEFLLNDEIPRLEGIALSRERAERRQLELELMPRKRSSRIQEVTIKKTREEEEEERRREEERKRREEKEARRLAAEAKAKEEERRLRAEAREAERIKEEADRRKLEQERSELRARRLMEREGLLRSDRLHHTKCSMTGSGSEASTPLAGSCPSNPSLNFQTVFADSSDIVSNASSHAVASDCLRGPSADENGVPVVKASSISTPLSSDVHHDTAAPSAAADVKKVVPTAADVLASAVQIKHDHAGCGVKKVLLEMQQRHPDWAITEHRVNKLLHENGLANVKKPSNVTANTDDKPNMLPQQQQSHHAVPDIHFDILSLPQPHAVPDVLWPKPPSPSLSSAPREQPANAVHLCSFEPESVASSAGCTGDASNSGTIAALDRSNSIDLGKLFGTAAADASNMEAPSVV